MKKNGNVNVVHYLQILEAELASLQVKNKKAEESFKAACNCHIEEEWFPPG
jgi:hypothetical protein